MASMCWSPAKDIRIISSCHVHLDGGALSVADHFDYPTALIVVCCRPCGAGCHITAAIASHATARLLAPAVRPARKCGLAGRGDATQ